jgi:hypothetical protein
MWKPQRLIHPLVHPFAPAASTGAGWSRAKYNLSQKMKG